MTVKARQDRAARLLPALLAAVRKEALIVPGDRVLAACSGGPDSVALVALLLELRREMPLDVRLAHFNHRLRDGAGADERFVRDIGRRWVLPLAVESVDVRAYAARKKLNLEEAARELRYAFLRRAAAAAGATKIATGHTMTDQAETVLMRLMRGAGLSGLAGIAPVIAGGPCPIVRPLLGIDGRVLRAWLAAEGIPFREDPTNLDRRFLRNRVRAELLLEMEKRYEPRIVPHLAQLAGIAREDDELLAAFVRELADEFVIRKGRDATLDLRTLPALLPGLARRIAREFLKELKGDLRDVSRDDVDALLALGEGKELALGHGIVLGREGGRLGLKKRAPKAKAYEVLWDGRGDVAVASAGMTFRGSRRRARKSGAAVAGDDRTGADLDLATLEFPLVIRSRRPGDLYRPIGAPGRKKLKEILRAKGIPAAARDSWPVFLSGGGIVWAPGLPVGEKNKVTSATKSVLSIRLKRARPGAGRGRIPRP